MCIPVRIPVNQFIISKSQRRLLKQNEKTQVTFNSLEYDDEVFEIYKEHSAERFGKQVDREEFKNNFCVISCPSLLSKYYVDGILVAAGFLDVTSKGLSSVYFVFKKKYQHLGLGKYSVLKEIEYSIQNKLEYYYLGYYVKGNSIMEYKTRFHPFECYNWNKEQWETVEKNRSEVQKENV
jgi:arginine-tRNA-protein transferase